MSINCFNPCFNGSDSKSGQAQNTAPAGKRVSILVLMEVTLKDPCDRARLCQYGFQSLF